ncbi:DUF7574 domain-containing protein [Brevibacterium sp. CSND-B09]|uniref:DUF7574 domain-containing protein n=1 Tax=Brevibacterium sp. CSND-B09 TaxID=3462571 RepID=UPI00406A95BC
MIEIAKNEWGDAKVVGATEVLTHEDGGYEWDFFGSWYDPDAGVFYWYEDAGCSCNGPMDIVDTLSDLSVGSKDELIRAYKDFAKDSYNMLSSEKVAAEHDIKQAIKEATK